jgi:ABC-type phosphonate transport system ATPase subunit
MFMSETPLIQIRNLSKSYGDKLVLKGLSLDIFPGQVIGDRARKLQSFLPDNNPLFYS